MKMLSFWVDQDEAAAAQRWADELGIDTSVLREALRRLTHWCLGSTPWRGASGSPRPPRRPSR